MVEPQMWLKGKTRKAERSPGVNVIAGLWLIYNAILELGVLHIYLAW